jgi:autophagy-related protein 2
MAEDTAFYLTTKLASTDLRGDYVCVLDMDLFELTLRLCQSRSSAAPRVELTASNNVLHIRTCSDSFKVLMELITYYANYGDLEDPHKYNNGCEGSTSTPLRESPSEPALIDTQESGEKEKRMSQSQTEHVHDLVAEAMLENDSQRGTESPSCKLKSRNTFELHFESNGADEHSNGNAVVPTICNYYEPIMQTSSDGPIEINPSDDDDEEFCILENDPGVGIWVRQ